MLIQKTNSNKTLNFPYSDEKYNSLINLTIQNLFNNSIRLSLYKSQYNGTNIKIKKNILNSILKKFKKFTKKKK